MSFELRVDLVKGFIVHFYMILRTNQTRPDLFELPNISKFKPEIYLFIYFFHTVRFPKLSLSAFNLEIQVCFEFIFRIVVVFCYKFYLFENYIFKKNNNKSVFHHC